MRASRLVKYSHSLACSGLRVSVLHLRGIKLPWNFQNAACFPSCKQKSGPPTSLDTTTTYIVQRVVLEPFSPRRTKREHAAPRPRRQHPRPRAYRSDSCTSTLRAFAHDSGHASWRTTGPPLADHSAVELAALPIAVRRNATRQYCRRVPRSHSATATTREAAS